MTPSRPCSPAAPKPKKACIQTVVSQLCLAKIKNLQVQAVQLKIRFYKDALSTLSNPELLGFQEQKSLPALVIPGCSGCMCLVMQWKGKISGGFLKRPVFD